jgi:hypothetical protein
VPRLRAKSKPGMELRHFLSPHQCQRDLAVSLLVIDVRSRKVLTWDVEECENATLAAELVSRACL